jgi:hypothetical protein
MIQDLNLRMDYQLTLTTSGQSTYYIDTLAPADAMPAGSLAMWKVMCYTTPVSGTGATLTITLQTCANNLFDSNAVTLAATSALVAPNIQAQTANIAPPDYVAWPYTPASAVLGPVLIWVAIPVGCQRYLRTGYVIGGTGNFASIGLTSEIILDGDKLLSNNFPIEGADIK